jgi:hypothetical protein
MVHPYSQQELAGLSVATATADAFRLPDKNKVLLACAREPNGGVHSHTHSSFLYTFVHAYIMLLQSVRIR